VAVTEYLGDTGNLEFELRSVNQKILTDLDPRSVRSWDMSTDLRISSTLRRTAREGRLTDTDTDPDPYRYRWNSKGGPKRGFHT